jgi:hypothetical protein
VSITLDEARADVKAKAIGRGTHCPCCDQYVRVYRRAFTATMARALIWLYWYQRLHEQEWVHVNQVGPDFIHQSGGSFATMRHWGFIRERPPSAADLDSQRCQGYWQITSRGQTAVGLVKFSKYVTTFNMEKVGESQDQLTDIRECLGRRFDYKAMMEARADVS